MALWFWDLKLGKGHRFLQKCLQLPPCPSQKSWGKNNLTPPKSSSPVSSENCQNSGAKIPKEFILTKHTPFPTSSLYASWGQLSWIQLQQKKKKFSKIRVPSAIGDYSRRQLPLSGTLTTPSLHPHCCHRMTEKDLSFKYQHLGTPCLAEK